MWPFRSLEVCCFFSLAPVVQEDEAEARQGDEEIITRLYPLIRFPGRNGGGSFGQLTT